MADPGITPGQRYRIATDPGRVGVATGLVQDRGGERRVQVQFPEGLRYVPFEYLEVVAEGGDDPLDLLRRGRFAHPPDLRRTLTHARLTGRLADVIYSMDATGTDFYAYQFKPLVKLINSATTGILIADEVGLGKTIEAGLIWTELRARHDYSRLLVLCPAMLRSKWKNELGKRFGVDARIVDADEMREALVDAAMDPDRNRFALVASLQGARPRKGWRPEDENHKGSSSELARLLDGRAHDELIDLAIIDEAHYLRNSETMTAELGRLVRRCSKHIVLLSATPVHLKSTDLYALVNLADPDSFERVSTFNEVLASNQPLVAASSLIASGRATKEQLQNLLLDALKMPHLATSRQIIGLLEQLDADLNVSDPKTAADLGYRLETANLLGHVVTRTRRREVEEWRVVREPIPESIPMTDVERMFYEEVTEIVRGYCARSDTLEDFLLVMPQRQVSSSMPAAFKAWVERKNDVFETADEDLDDDYELTNEADRVGPLVAEIVGRVGSVATYEVLRENDSKYKRLVSVLQELRAEHPQAKVVLFSYFKPTLNYLQERLEQDGLSTIILHGDIPNKEAVVEAFMDAKTATVLLSSEVASEGIDLQFAWAMVNYDLPWNPMRVEQRIGRIDRLGQSAPKIMIWNMFYRGTIDDRIYTRLYQRLQLFERTIGGLEPILGREIRELAMALFRSGLTPEEEEERIRQTAHALERRRTEEERLESEAASLVAHSDYILRQVTAAKELGRFVRGEDLRWYVIEFFRRHYGGSEFQQMDDGFNYEVTLSSEARADLDAFLTERKLRAQTRLGQVNAVRVSCRFDNAVASGPRQRREVINQFHPVVRFVSCSLGQLSGEGNRPAIAVKVRRRDLRNPIDGDVFVFAVQRWSMSGLQNAEYLYHVAAPCRDGAIPLTADESELLVTLAATHGVDWLTAQSEMDCELAYAIANDVCVFTANTAYDLRLKELQDRNEDRAAVQLVALQRHYQAEEKKLAEILARQKHRPDIAPMTQGRMNANIERFERSKRDIEKRRSMTFQKEEICVGILRVVD